MVFELLVILIVVEALMICYLASQLRTMSTQMAVINNKMDDPKTQQSHVPTTVMSDNRDEVNDDDDDDYVRSRSSKAPRSHKSHYPYYVIWKSTTIPVGIYHCEWDDILFYLPGQSYPAKGLKLKGARNLEEAVQLFQDKMVFLLDHKRRVYTS